MLIYLPYLPNIEFFRILNSNSNVTLEIYDSFPKQTYRNRCLIQTSQNSMFLTVPLIKCRKKQLTKDTRIAYYDDWISKHLKSLKSSYSKSAYFEYYFSDIELIISKKHEFLIDLNLELLYFLCKKLEIETSIKLSTDFNINIDSDNDFRFNIASNNYKSKFYPTKSYFQVFSDRMDFIQNLSIVDTLFNIGPESKKILL